MMTEQEEQEFIKKHLSDTPPVETQYQVGDIVTFTNSYGIPFPNKTIIGFRKEVDPEYPNKFIHLNGNTPYWIALSEERLAKQNGLIEEAD